MLVEGASDQAALEALAKRRGRDLAAEAISIVAIGGATNLGHFLDEHAGGNLALAGLCDAREEDSFRRDLARAGFGSSITRTGMERLGFYVCDADLEDELIRSLGANAVERVIEELGELRSFRSFQRQPAQRERSREQQLRRFMGTQSGRKVLYARALVEALDLTRVPRPLDGVLAHVAKTAG